MDTRPPLMMPTAGITVPHFSKDPLGTEGELTPGPDDWVPYDEEANKLEIEAMGFDAKRVSDTPKERAQDPLAQLL